jgi:general secretion pathway protein G
MAALELNQRRQGGLTLIELMIAIAVAGTLACIAVPAYSGYVEKLRAAQAVDDISRISVTIERWRSNNGGFLPDTLAQLGVPLPADPWGRAYAYLRIEGIDPLPKNVRRDKHLKPVNADFDLYSNGANGVTKDRFDHKNARDDVVRANGGAYIGLAGDY